jgi:tetratricopeptide (TPR) repeat protein
MELLGGVRGAVRRHSLSFRIGLGLVVLAACIVGILLARTPKPVRSATIEARLELAAGEVRLEQGATSPTVISGVPLPTGAKLATGKGARALIRLSDGSAIFLRGDTRVSLGSQGIALDQGEAWLDAPASERGGLVHKLGDVTVSAAGAGLSLERDGEATSVYVARGLAVVEAPGGRVEVNAGEQATVTGKNPPKITAVSYWEDWTGGMADHRPLAGEGTGSGRIYGVDRAAPAGTPARTLEISRQTVHAVIRDGLAETEVDQTFGNPGGRQVEGWYWFTIPERAVVTSFAVETDGSLIEGEVIEKQEASARYAAAIASAHEPALLEWIDGRSYRARIFPVPASGSRRVVLRYMELVTTHGGRFEYVYPMRPSDEARPGAPGGDAATIGELSLAVDLGDAGVGMPLATLADAVVEDGGRRVTMRRSGFAPRADFQLEGQLKTNTGALRVARFSAGGDRADYLMARYAPDIDWAGVKELPTDLAVVVDTSASADESSRQQKTAAAEAILRAMSPQDHFTLIALDTKPTVLYPKEGLADASEKEIAAALERLAEHAAGGATDLGALFDAALGRVHGTEQPAVIYIGDGLATSGEVSGDRLAERLRRSLAASRARFFTVGVGPNANHALLHELARAGGGQAFRIDDVEGSTSEVLRLAGAIKTPTITDLTMDLGAGLDEPMLTAAGKVSRGEEVVLLARTHHALPEKATVKGRIGGQDFAREYRIELDAGVGAALVPRLWAAEKMRRLLGSSADPEEHRGKIVELGLEYGLVTPFTSTLALESEQAYAQQGIRRRSSPLRGVRLTALTPSTERDIVAAMAPLSPALGMGCAKSEGAPASEQREDQVAPQSGARRSVEATMPQSPPAAAAAPAPISEGIAEGKAKQEADPSAVAADGPRADEKSSIGLDSIGQTAPGRGAGASGGLAFKGQGVAGKPALTIAGNGAAPTGQKVPAAPPPSPQNRFDTLARHEPPPPPPPVKTPPPPPREVTALSKAASMGNCSDSARRPLAERIVIWSNRLRRTDAVADLLARYDGARVTCELPDWRAQAALLQLIQVKARDAHAVEALLAHFADDRETQRFVAQTILRRSVDPATVVVVRRALFSGETSWDAIDNDLAAIPGPSDRVARLRVEVQSHKDDPQGEVRLVHALADAGQKDEALALGRRLRDRGFMSPALSLELGDVLASSGYEDDAIRTYSEIVEFDPQSADSRRLLGDVYLRHGWYPAAYRQYKTLADTASCAAPAPAGQGGDLCTPGPQDALGWLRLAAAAAGSGRVDEALRLQRQVSSAEGTPGPSDPRAWARLLSAARLGRLLADAQAPAGQADSVGRKLKELGLFDSPGALSILIWEDYAAALSLVTLDGDKEAPLGEKTDAVPAGVTATRLPLGDLPRVRWVVRWQGDPPKRGVDFTVETLTWDGKSFQVKLHPGTLSNAEKEIVL